MDVEAEATDRGEASVLRVTILIPVGESAMWMVYQPLVKTLDIPTFYLTCQTLELANPENFCEWRLRRLPYYVGPCMRNLVARSKRLQSTYRLLGEDRTFGNPVHEERVVLLRNLARKLVFCNGEVWGDSTNTEKKPLEVGGHDEGFLEGRREHLFKCSKSNCCG